MEISQVILKPLKNATSGNSASLLTLYQVSQVLRIERADIDDSGNIKCEAENDVGKETAAIQVNVQCKLDSYSIVHH